MKPWPWVLAAIVLASIAAAAWHLGAPRPVALVQASAAPLVEVLVFSGRVEAPARVELGATVTGRVVDVPVREGDVVMRGTVLVTLEAAESRAQLAQAQAALRVAETRLRGQREVAQPTTGAALEQARATLEAARREAARSRELFARGYVSQARVDETDRQARVAQAQLDAAGAAARANTGDGTETAQARLRIDEARAAVALAEARLAQARIVAPADGRIVSRQVDPGQIVQPGRTLLVFAATGPTELVGQADEKFLSRLERGQPARVIADAFQERPFAARVERIAPGVDAQRGTVEVKFAVAEPPGFLREDMTLSMAVTTGRREQALTLPAAAVLGAGAEGRIRRIVDGRIAEQRVRTGLRTLERVEIVDGLAPGDRVLADPLGAEPGARARPARDGEAMPPRFATDPSSSPVPGAGPALPGDPVGTR